METNNKLLAWTDISETVKGLKAAGTRIVFTNGCFDIIHPGHIKLLQQARSLGDCLILGLNSDDSIKHIKDPRRPILQQQERVAVLSAISCIDFIVLFDEPTPQNLIEAIIPDVLVKGGDWAPDKIVGAQVVQANGGRVEIVDLEDGLSTTNLIQRIVSRYGRP